MFYCPSKPKTTSDVNVIQDPTMCVNSNSGLASMLIDYYEINMVYASWVNNKHEDNAVFEAFFRKCPFGGEFCIFAGLAECIRMTREFNYGDKDLKWLQNILPDNIDPDFFVYLRNIKMDDIQLYAIAEGSPVFPNTPLLRVCGPLGKVQLLETAFLNAINYASLVATNAARYRKAASPYIKLSEFGARKAHGPNGALSASKYAYLGGFDSTSNVLAARLYGIPLAGTLAHSFVMSYSGLQELDQSKVMLKSKTSQIDIREEAKKYLAELQQSVPMFLNSQTNQGELASFIAFAIAYPSSFVAVIDTYNVLLSGLPNFCAVALCIISLGYQPIGVRIDSGDLLYLSKAVRDVFKICAIKYPYAADSFNSLSIILSNDLSEDTLSVLNVEGNIGQSNVVSACGVGTHLVTCYKQPSLGAVFKLVEINNRPVLKISEVSEKMSIPGAKSLYRLYGKDGIAICDLMAGLDEDRPKVNENVFVRHPFVFSKRANVIPNKIENLLQLYLKDGDLLRNLPSLDESRAFCMQAQKTIREDNTRLINPRPYKVSLSSNMFNLTQTLLDKNIPVTQLD